jgi:hypothetical protein
MAAGKMSWPVRRHEAALVVKKKGGKVCVFEF